MTRKYRSHWSDNHNQLGEPTCATGSNEAWPLSWVYFHAESLKVAKARVVEFNRLLIPTDSSQPAHCPTALLAHWGFLTFPAAPSVEVDAKYLVPEPASNPRAGKKLGREEDDYLESVARDIEDGYRCKHGVNIPEPCTECRGGKATQLGS